METPPLSCQKCPGLCCKMAGYVEVSRRDTQRLAKFLGLTKREFEEKHIVKKMRNRAKLIKTWDKTCQFLTDGRRCSVYAARPTLCRQYNCWEDEDTTVYEYASFVQLSVKRLRKLEKDG
ncbi:MAG: YkgJ family cysteine cluster protein [Proteobacteria bacterium]|nr:YkgJ family cysteine cluster protein [Pseudomonadota bacterium]MBI3498176.1 YkgJ family cysteine cluster protein [Pseudomonadota bacterium]